jgi:hypothetical protein
VIFLRILNDCHYFFLHLFRYMTITNPQPHSFFFRMKHWAYSWSKLQPIYWHIIISLLTLPSSNIVPEICPCLIEGNRSMTLDHWTIVTISFQWSFQFHLYLLFEMLKFWIITSWLFSSEQEKDYLDLDTQTIISINPITFKNNFGKVLPST